MAKPSKLLLIAVLFLLTARSAFAEYCLNVHIWRLQDLTDEMRKEVIKTVEREKDNGVFREDFSTKHGKELRQGADGVRQDASCEDIKSKKFDYEKDVNTGKWSRDTETTTVFVSFRTGLFSKETVVEAQTVSGIARFYFDKPYQIRIRFKNQKEFISPVQGYIKLESGGWLDDVVSVHGLKN